MRPVLLATVIFVAACGGSDESTPPVHDAASDDAAVTIDGGTGAVCGGFAGFQCEDTHWCDWVENSCGGDDGTGTCQPRPDVCKPLEEPVCGCDGTVYVTDCAAAMAGQDVSDFNSCTPPAGSFACGHLFCDTDTQYCRRSVSDVAGFPDDWSCQRFPNGCGANPDCGCLSAELCGDMCSVTGDGLRLTCPGG